jgi:glutamyl-tRNA synthetase
VDDVLMQITHVIRGDDHIANTPKQMVLYEALGFSFPQFAHIPLIVGADRARLSKREGATSVTAFRQAGYLPDAFVNYLALLGWSPGGNRELMPPEEIVRLFDLSRVRKTAAQFDQDKLDWLNSQYIKRLPVSELSDRLAERLIAKGWFTAHYDRAWMERVATLLQDRLKTLADLEEEHTFFFREPAYQEDAVAAFLRQDGVAPRLLALKERLEALPTFETEQVERTVRQFIAEHGLEPKQLIHPLRVAVTGRSVSPPLFEVMSILGTPTVVSRMEYAATRLATG